MPVTYPHQLQNLLQSWSSGSIPYIDDHEVRNHNHTFVNAWLRGVSTVNYAEDNLIKDLNLSLSLVTTLSSETQKNSDYPNFLHTSEWM